MIDNIEISVLSGGIFRQTGLRFALAFASIFEGFKDFLNRGGSGQNGPSGSSAGNSPENKQGDSQADNGNYKILIVDDVPENRLFLEVLLKKKGYRIVSCENGQLALEILRSADDIDVVLMDIYMPVMDGLEATKTIKDDPSLSHIPVIAVTAGDSQEEKWKRIEAGCDDYVAKPVAAENLFMRISKFKKQIDQRRQAGNGGQIISTCADDPCLRKTIDMFVENLPARIQEIQDAFESKEIEDLAVKVHSIKGLGGMAGYQIYSEQAKKLESLIKSDCPDFEQIKRSIDELAEMCRRTSSGCK